MKTKAIVSKKEIKDILLRMLAGEDSTAIAASLNLNQKPTRATKPVKAIKSKYDIALSEIRKGATISVAATAAGVSGALVYRWMKAAGLESGRKQKTLKAQELLKEGKLSVAEIAKKVDLSRAAVHGIKSRVLADK